MIVEWYGLKILTMGFIFGYFYHKKISDLNKAKCYEIKSFERKRE